MVVLSYVQAGVFFGEHFLLVLLGHGEMRLDVFFSWASYVRVGSGERKQHGGRHS